MSRGSHLRGGTPGDQEPSCNRLLIISDIHLGEDILAQGPDYLAEYIRVLNKELADFVRCHRARAQGEHWQLIINGDMFDFLKISIRPDAVEAHMLLKRPMTEKEEAHGLANTEDNVVWKLHHILAIHRPLFRELAGFLLDGHQITIIEGNHDAEMYFPKVQESMRAELVSMAREMHLESERAEDSFDPKAVAQNLTFKNWFEANLGHFHVEHGHQYDEFCSFEYNLAPFERPTKETLATPLSHKVLPYFVDLLGDFSTHHIDSMGVTAFLKIGVDQGFTIFWKMAKLYVVMILDVLKRAGPGREMELRRMRAAHRARLEQMTEETPYVLHTLERLDGLKSRPAEYSVYKMIRMLYMDVFAAILLYPLLWLVNWFVVDIPGWILLGLPCAMFLHHWLSGARTADVPGALRAAAARIASITGARYVVFGHSHHPEIIDLSLTSRRQGTKAYYINSGSWVTREILLGERGRGMTYVDIGPEGASLKAWRGPDKEPRIVSRTAPT